MPSYIVHKYFIVREPLAIAARSMADALKKADKIPRDLSRAFDAEETTDYLVDIMGVSDFNRSRSFKANHAPAKTVRPYKAQR